MERKILLVLALAVLLAGCSDSSGKSGSYIRVAEFPVEFLFPGGWAETARESPYELQCFPRDEQMMTGIFMYEESEIEVNGGPLNLLEHHIDDIRSKRQNFMPVEAKTTERGEGTGLTTAVYSGERDGETYYYRFTLIEFDDMPEIVAVAIQTAFPDQWQKAKPILERITRSARIVKT